MKYKFIEDLTSDVMFEAYGRDLKELFQNAADAMFSVICQPDKVEQKEKRSVAAEAESPEKLIVAWLQELIALVDTDEMFFSRFEIKSISNTSLKAEVWGEPIVPEKGETVVKAVTNYGFSFERGSKGYKVRISLDI